MSGHTPQLDVEIAARRARWLTALRSGDYRQATGALRVGDGYCCLGVAEDVRGVDWTSPDVVVNFGVGTHVVVYDVDDDRYTESVTLTPDGAAWLGLTTTSPVVTVWFEPPEDVDSYFVDDSEGAPPRAWTHRSLAELNDEGMTLAEVAAVIDDQPAGWTGDAAAARAEAARRAAEGVPEPVYGTEVPS